MNLFLKLFLAITYAVPPELLWQNKSQNFIHELFEAYLINQIKILKLARLLRIIKRFFQNTNFLYTQLCLVESKLDIFLVDL